jgi:magnesium transporter
MTVTVHAADDTRCRAVTGLDSLDEAFRSRQGPVWIDADERSDLLEAFLRDRLELHPLIVEDIFFDRTTPKVEDFGAFLYVVVHAVRPDGLHPHSLQTIELDLVIGRDWLFTHHGIAMSSVDGVAQELTRNPRLLQRGPAYLAHAIIDRLTDHYLPVVDRFDDEIDEVEKALMGGADPALLRRLFALKRSLQRLRRVATYQRDLLQRLSRGEFEIIPERSLPFFRDVYDHFVRIADLAESYRELVTAALEIYLSVAANRTNEIMKVLAMISTIMLPLSFIAGVYGMNFENMPEIKWRLGYPFALGLMLLVAVALGVFFRRRKWF